MKKITLALIWFVLILSLGACDKAGEQMSLGTVAPEAVSGGLVILNNLAETISVLDSSGALHNNVQFTGSSPNHILYADPYIYIVNSLSNSIEVLSAKDLSIIKEISVGTGKNPMFAAIIRDHVLAVTEFKEGGLDIVYIDRGIVNPVDLTEIKLPRDNNDVAGWCYPYGVAVNNGKIFVTLANLTDYYGGLTAAGPGVVAVIDASSYDIIEIIELKGADPVFAANFGNKVIIACAGHYEGDITSPRPSGFKGDGTIEIIDTETLVLERTYDLEDSAPFSFSISEDNILYASNAMGSGIPRVNLATDDVMDNLELDGPFISAVLAPGDTIYALDFNNDLLFALDKEGHVLNTYLVGDGPIAMLSLAEVSAEEHIIPVIKVSPPIASPGVDITFDASASVLPGGDYTFSWDFGDGSLSEEGIMVVHAYNNQDQYIVTLTVTDDSGRTATKKCTVYIVEKSPFATEVIDYSPAPGQFIDNPQFNDPDRALGPPVGGGPQSPDNSSQVSLGGFGGSITLKFDHMVMDNPENPLGLDFILFGNAFGGWVEPGVVEISDDPKVEEDPGQAKWYLIPGTAMESNTEEPVYRKVEKYYEETGEIFYAYQIPPETSYVNPDTGEVNWGYADFSPVMELPKGADPVEFYTNPDNPYEVGTDEGSCGGDAFDIAWAIDPVTGEPAGLGSFQYIKITTGVDYYSETLGEISTEVDAVADIGLEY
ncbi:MAG: PKD domain-containing protein [Deltaproteobacteria bacterium]|nr:PKD domain-containing protein [Deltaproteobacteria bacterium]